MYSGPIRATISAITRADRATVAANASERRILALVQTMSEAAELATLRSPHFANMRFTSNLYLGMGTYLCLLVQARKWREHTCMQYFAIAYTACEHPLTMEVSNGLH